MLHEEVGDIVLGNYPIICQQVNCKGVMGSGLAKQIRTKYPEAYNSYTYFIKQCKEFDEPLLGSVNKVILHDGRILFNMFAQDGYGRDKRYTDYTAFEHCLEENRLLVPENKTIAIPYLIGCGLGGGDWYIIKGMLEDFSNIIKNKVIIVALK